MDNFVGLLAAAGLILFNAFFVAAEYALVSVRRSRIEEMVANGSGTAKVVKKAINNLDRYIAATQLSITMANLGLGWVGEPALGHIIEPIIRAVLQPIIHFVPDAAIDLATIATIGGALSFAIITFLVVIVGELMPKSITLQNPERTALFVARPVDAMATLFAVPIRVLNATGNALLRLIGVEPASEENRVHSIEELKILVRSSAESGVLAEGEDEIVKAVFEMGETRARQLMVPRTEIIAFRVDDPVDDVIDSVADSALSKFPLYENDLDNTIGILHVKDLMRAMRQGSDIVLKDLARPALFLSESITINDLLGRFRQERQHLALLLDEYGGTAGLITLEDLLEEIVGDVRDAFESEQAELEYLPDGSALVNGLMPIEEVNDLFGLELHDPNYETIAGFVLGQLDRMAQVGDVVETGIVRAQVEAMDGLRIDRVRLIVTGEPSSERPAADEESEAAGDSEE